MNKKEKFIGSIIIVVIFVLFLFIGYGISKPKQINENEIFEESNNNVYEEKQNDITVEIKGEVKKPGVYELKEGSRIKDLVAEAGGYTELADTDNIIQVTPLKDSDCVIILKKGEENSNNAQNSIRLSESGIQKSGDDKININNATKEELETLQGIGPVTADKIINYRETNNGFKDIEELKKVGGIGDAKFDAIKDKVDIR